MQPQISAYPTDDELRDGLERLGGWLKKGLDKVSLEEMWRNDYQQLVRLRARQKAADCSPEYQAELKRMEAEIFERLPATWQATIRAHDQAAALRRATGQPLAKQAARPRL